MGAEILVPGDRVTRGVRDLLQLAAEVRGRPLFMASPRVRGTLEDKIST